MMAEKKEKKKNQYMFVSNETHTSTHAKTESLALNNFLVFVPKTFFI